MAKKRLIFQEEVPPLITQVITQLPSGVQTLPVAQTVSAGMAVGLSPEGLVPYNTIDLTHFGRYVGVALQTGNRGEQIQVNTTRRTSLQSWTLVPGTRYYASSQGWLTPEPIPELGAWFTHALGLALTSQDMLLLDRSPIKLAL